MIASRRGRSSSRCTPWSPVAEGPGGRSPQSPLAPPAPPTLAQLHRRLVAARLGAALVNSTLITVVSLLLLIARRLASAAYSLARDAPAARLRPLHPVPARHRAAVPARHDPAVPDSCATSAGSARYRGMVLFYTGIQMPFTMFLYIGFLRALPRDFEDAALIDGCTPPQAFTGRLPAAAADHRHRADPQRGLRLERLLHPAAVPGRSDGDRAGRDLRLRRPVRLRLGLVFAALVLRLAADPGRLPAAAAAI